MLVSSFNLSQSFNNKPYLFLQKTVQIRDQFFLYMDPKVIGTMMLVGGGGPGG